MSTTGCVYCFRFGAEDCFKIGRTKNPPDQRRKDVSVGSPRKLRLYREVKTDNPAFLEKYIHQLLNAQRAENGEFFNVSIDELDRAIADAEAFLAEASPVLQQAAKLKKRRPTDAELEPSEAALSLHRELKEAQRQSYLLEQKILVLKGKLQVEIGENSGLRGVASWEWQETWELDEKGLKKHARQVWEQFKRLSATRVFRVK